MTQGPVDQIEFLARSRARVRILEHLLSAGAATRAELRDDLAVAQSTVARALQGLQDQDWIEADGRAYRLTPVGEVVASEFVSFAETMRAVDELSPFLRWFPYREVDLEVSDLCDAELTTTRSGDPYAPARKHFEIFRSCEAFRGLMPSVDLQGLRVTEDKVLSGELTMEIVVGPRAGETLRSEEYASLLREQIATEDVAVFVADEEPPFYLGLADDGTAQIGVEDDEGFPRALVETDDARVTDWGEDLYREYRTDATELSAEDL